MPVTLYSKESYTAAVPQLTDLIFDIDMDAYDEYRLCGCEGKQICDDCWYEFIVPAVTLIDNMMK